MSRPPVKAALVGTAALPLDTILGAFAGHARLVAHLDHPTERAVADLDDDIALYLLGEPAAGVRTAVSTILRHRRHRALALLIAPECDERTLEAFENLRVLHPGAYIAPWRPLRYWALPNALPTKLCRDVGPVTAIHIRHPSASPYALRLQEVVDFLLTLAQVTVWEFWNTQPFTVTLLRQEGDPEDHDNLGLREPSHARLTIATDRRVANSTIRLEGAHGAAVFEHVIESDGAQTLVIPDPTTGQPTRIRVGVDASRWLLRYGAAAVRLVDSGNDPNAVAAFLASRGVPTAESERTAAWVIGQYVRTTDP